MPNHYYQNFSVQQRAAFQNAVDEAQLAIPAIFADAILNTQVVATRAYRQFFGEFAVARHERVLGILSLMDLALNSAGITFSRVVGGPQNVCAATHPPYGIWEDQTPADIVQSAHLHQWAYRMEVRDRFYGARNCISGELADAQFNTLCHELSHLVGNTEDVINGQSVYGYWQARNLAVADPDSAVMCAENYGFYCEACYTGQF